jgi:YD repeat-containing protein
MIVIDVVAVPPAQGALQPTFLIRSEDGKEIASASAWSHSFSLSTLGLKSPLTLEVIVDCPTFSTSGKKICFTERFSFGGCESGNCGSGGSCQEGVGQPSGSVEPSDPNAFNFELPIGSSSQGDETTGIHFSLSPDSPISIGDFKIHSNGGFTHSGNVITTGTTVTTLSNGGGGVTAEIKKVGSTAAFRTYQFNSSTTGNVNNVKTLTLVETRCDAQTIVHVWTKSAGVFSFSTANGLRTTTASIELDANFVRTERHKTYELVSNQEILVSDESLSYQAFPWGERLIQRKIHPSTAGNITTWTYGGPSDGLAYGKLKSLTRYDGYEETHTYGADFHQVDSSGNQQSKTTWSGGTTTYETSTNGIVHARTEEILNGNTITQNRYTSDTEFLQTITTYVPTGSDFGGQPATVTNPDTTKTTYSRARVSGNRVTTVSTGKFVSNALTDGTTTITTDNAQGQTVESITTDLPSQIVIAHTKALELDGFGRPKTIGHFPNPQNVPVYSELRTYTCCKLTSETDMHGVTTEYQYDLLGRQTHTQRQGVVQETIYQGLTRTSHRYPVGQSATDFTSIGESYRNLAGTIEENWEPATSSDLPGEPLDGALVNTTTTTTYNPGGGLSRIVVTTVPGNHIQTSEYLLDGRLKKSYGALSPHTEYAYTATTDGMISARALLEGANRREITATLSDWAGRTHTSGRLATLTSTTFNDYTTHTYDDTTG